MLSNFKTSRVITAPPPDKIYGRAALGRAVAPLKPPPLLPIRAIRGYKGTYAQLGLAYIA